MKTKDDLHIISDRLSHAARGLDTVALDMTVAPASYIDKPKATKYVLNAIDGVITELLAVKYEVTNADTR